MLDQISEEEEKKRMNSIQSCNKWKKLEVDLEKIFIGTGNVYI